MRVYYLSLLIVYSKTFRFQSNECNVYHTLMQKAMGFNDLAIVSLKGNDYRIHFCYMSKDDDINLLKILI